MGLSAYALFTLAEFKEQLGLVGDQKDEAINQIINRATATVEAYLGRQLVTRGTLSPEFHTPGPCVSDLYLLEYPVITVTSVHESWTRTYDATTLLVADTDYIVEKPAGILHRIYSTSAGQRQWINAFSSVRVSYSAGYADRLSVPDDIRSVCWELMARKWVADKGESHGIASQSDATGSVTRFLPSELLSLEKATLDKYRRREWAPTGRRDA